MKYIASKVRSELAHLEDEFDIQVLYACEAGSRAWGFPSTDSDYDIRFIYIHKPEWYLSITEYRDVIERMISPVLDFSGWDLRKALRLFRKSNPNLIEWIKSPIVYWSMYRTREKLETLLPTYYNPTATYWHYLHMARGNYKEYLKGDTVWLKKYLYVLRPLMATMWIEQGRGIVPVQFDVIVEKLDYSDTVRKAIRKLIERKKEGEELGRGSRNKAISAFIERELFLYRPENKKPKSIALQPLNRLFLDLIANAWDVIV